MRAAHASGSMLEVSTSRSQSSLGEHLARPDSGPCRYPVSALLLASLEFNAAVIAGADVEEGDAGPNAVGLAGRPDVLDLRASRVAMKPLCLRSTHHADRGMSGRSPRGGRSGWPQRTAQARCSDLRGLLP